MPQRRRPCWLHVGGAPYSRGKDEKGQCQRKDSAGVAVGTSQGQCEGGRGWGVRCTPAALRVLGARPCPLRTAPNARPPSKPFFSRKLDTESSCSCNGSFKLQMCLRSDSQEECVYSPQPPSWPPAHTGHPQSPVTSHHAQAPDSVQTCTEQNAALGTKRSVS